eukprot:1853097-Pyramimonas_sp.AAC.1
MAVATSLARQKRVAPGAADGCRGPPWAPHYVSLKKKQSLAAADKQRRNKLQAPRDGGDNPPGRGARGNRE